MGRFGSTCSVFQTYRPEWFCLCIRLWLLYSSPSDGSQLHSGWAPKPLAFFTFLHLLCLQALPGVLFLSVPPLQYQYGWLPHLADVCSDISLFSLFWPPYLKSPLPFPSAFSLPLLCFSLISSHDFKIYSFIMFDCCLFYLLKWKEQGFSSFLFIGMSQMQIRTRWEWRITESKGRRNLEIEEK